MALDNMYSDIRDATLAAFNSSLWSVVPSTVNQSNRVMVYRRDGDAATLACWTVSHTIVGKLNVAEMKVSFRYAGHQSYELAQTRCAVESPSDPCNTEDNDRNDRIHIL